MPEPHVNRLATWPRNIRLFATLLCATCVLMLSGADEADVKKETAKEKVTSKEALQSIQDLVGEWRGVGMPQRGSRKGAWIEGGTWKWSFPMYGPELTWTADEKAKQILSGGIIFEEGEQRYHFRAKLADESSRSYFGTLNDKGHLVLESEPDSTNSAAPRTVHRITLSLLSDKRMTMLLQTRQSDQTFLRRTAEVGYTRKGTSIAGNGSGGPVCIVTGGKGTITVSHEGKTYYVCCSGCKQAFDEDPAGVIKAYLASRKADMK